MIIVFCLDLLQDIIFPVLNFLKRNSFDGGNSNSMVAMAFTLLPGAIKQEHHGEFGCWAANSSSGKPLYAFIQMRTCTHIHLFMNAHAVHVMNLSKQSDKHGTRRTCPESI
jgi:hypothetical protein